MDPLPPIPTPPAQRWREFRIQVLPVVVFVGVLTAVVCMWKSYVVPSGVVGEFEAIRANITVGEQMEAIASARSTSGLSSNVFEHALPFVVSLPSTARPSPRANR